MRWLWVAVVLGGCATTPQPLTFRMQRFSSVDFYEPAQDRGAVVLVDIWASWCKPCRRSMPSMVALANRFKERGLRFITINTDDDTLGINEFLDGARVNPVVLLDERGAFTHGTLHIYEVPTTLLVDRKGLIRFKHAGFDDDTSATLERELELLLAEAQ